MIIKTRKLAATNTAGERMRAIANSGASLTIPYPYESVDPHWMVAVMLARANGYAAVVHETGNTYTTTEEVYI